MLFMKKGKPFAPFMATRSQPAPGLDLVFRDISWPHSKFRISCLMCQSLLTELLVDIYSVLVEMQLWNYCML